MSDDGENEDAPMLQRIIGRGVNSNRTGRYERYRHVQFDDGWTQDFDDRSVLRTETRREQAKTAITWNSSPDLGFDRSVNPYRGCEHGCVYCFARPGHTWLGMSAGLDFETRLIARPNLPSLLRKELRRPGYSPAPIAIGTFTDPYQPIEKEHEIMRGLLQVLSDFNHPVAIVTKGALIERDLDLLSGLAERGLVHVGISVTTLDPEIARKMEPRVPGPARRLTMIRRLSGAGVPVRAMVSPVVPGLTDSEIEPILAACAGAGAQAASWIMLRLPQEVSGLVQDWLQAVHPLKAEKIMARLREMHGGKEYSSQWGRRMRGEGVYAQLIGQRFSLAARKLNLDQALPVLRTDLFRPDTGRQLSLFETEA